MVFFISCTDLLTRKHITVQSKSNSYYLLFFRSHALRGNESCAAPAVYNVTQERHSRHSHAGAWERDYPKTALFTQVTQKSLG
jgi:hypothetical protein